jgi:hypothetical protein
MASEAADRIEALEKNAHLDHILIEQKRAEIIARGNRISELEAALREIIKARKLNHSVSILRIAELALEGKP